MEAWATGGTFAEISKSKFCELQIPLPPLEVQNEIVAEIKGYQQDIQRFKSQIAVHEASIQTTLARLWGDVIPVSPED
jgi:type I restriction enzyme M protein